MPICGKCGSAVNNDKIEPYLVRAGYCPTMFPFLKYHKLSLCLLCYQHQKRVEKIEKLLALAGLAIVFYLVFYWPVILFIHHIL